MAGVVLAANILWWALPPLLSGDVPPVPQAPARLSRIPALRPAPTLAAFGAFLAYYAPILARGFWALYSRITPERALDSAARQRVYRLISEEQAIHAREIHRRLGLGWGTTMHHLQLLERKGLVASFVLGRHRHYARAGALSAAEFRQFALLRNPNARRIMETISRRPGIGQKELRAMLGLTSPLATWHLQRLVRVDLIKEERNGRTVSYRTKGLIPMTGHRG